MSALLWNSTKANPQGKEADNNTEQDIPSGHQKLSTTQEIKGFKSKGGKGGKPTGNTGEEEQPGLGGKEVVFNNKTCQHANDQAAKNIDDKRTQRKTPAHGVMQDPSGKQMATC